MYDIVIVISLLICLWILFNKKLRNSTLWYATITPLASIIGSGFLVAAPLLLLTFGQWAPLAMMLIVITAYGIGSSIRFNIQYAEPILQTPSFSLVKVITKFSQPALGIAYIISITFYLKLLSAFVLYYLGIHSEFYQNLLTSLLLLFNGIIGKFYGLSMLEHLENYSGNIRLGIIITMILAFAIYNVQLLQEAQWILPYAPNQDWLIKIEKLFGMLIIVQGFETSRYLGNKYTKEIRIKTMRYAQWISSIIYILFILVVMAVLKNITSVNETAIIPISHIVSPLLPLLIILVAILSQYSASIADTVGGGGLLYETTKHRLSVNNSYFLMALVAVMLVWLTNIYEIILIASKAFSIYYACEILISLTLIIFHCKKTPYRILSLGRNLLLLIGMILIILFGIPIK